MPTDDAPAPLPARFGDIRPLGEGAFGRVYAAVRDGAPVAVKVLAPHLADQPEVAWRFAAEWRTLTRLAHPAFPRAVEEGRTDDGAPFYAMELVAGTEPAGPLPAAAVRAALAGLAEALAYLHGLGLVHGDLKPENLRIAPDGHVRVLDVGLVAPVGARRETIAGTLEYLAPEALRKAPVAPAADLYALGALAFELWTGASPFQPLDGPARGPAELVRAHLTTAPPPLPADEDPALAALIGALLAKDPADRPASARAVLARLRGEAEEAAAPVGLRAGALVGRDDLLDAWRAALGAPGARLVLAGGPGLGKSRALDALRLEALLAGRAWVGAAGGGAGDAPAAALRAVVAQALAAAGLAPDDDLAAWLAGRLPASLAELEPPARKVAIAARAAAALAAAADATGGLAIGLDDWHRADEASRELAGAVARSLGAAPVAWAIATDPDAPAGALADGAAIHDLAPLTDDEATVLLAARLGAAPPPALAERLLPAAAGRPALLDLLLEHLAASGALKAGADGWALAEAGPGGALPASLEAAWAARLAGLAPAARRLAAYVAVAAPGGPVAAATAAELAGLAPDAAADALDALRAEGLAVADGGRVRLAVPGMAAAFLGDFDAATAAAVASAFARRLAGDGPADLLPPADLAAAAALAVAGDDDALAATLAAAAGRASLALGAPAEALRWLDEAILRLDRGPGADDRARLGAELPRAEALRLLDRLDAALAAYQPATARAAGVGDARAEAQAWIGLAKVRQMKGDYAGALEGFAQAERAGEPDQRARAAAGEARVRAFRGEPAEALAAAERAEALARAMLGAPRLPSVAGAEAVLAQALTMRGYLEATADPAQAPAARARLEEALAIGERLGDRAGMALAYDNLGNVLLAAGDLLGAAEVYARSVAHCQAAGLATEALAAGLNQAIVAAERGEATRAIALAADVARRAEALGRKFIRAAALTAEGEARARRGDHAGAQARLAEALAIAEALGNKLLEEHVRVHALEAALAAGDADAAAAHAARAAALVAETGHAEAAARLAALEAERLRRAGDPDGAEALAAPHAEAPNRIAARLARRALAEVALDRGRSDEAIGHAEAALAIARAWAAPWHEAGDLALLARARHAAGDDVLAAEHAREAMALAGDDHPAARGAAAPLAGARAASGGAAGAGPALDLAAYAAWTAALAGAADEGAAGRTALDAAMALTGAERGYLLAYHEGRLQKAIARGLDLEAEMAEGFSSSMVQRALVTGEPLYVADARTDAAWQGQASVMALDLRTVIVLPLTTPDALLGVLYLDRQALDPILGEPDLHLLGALAASAAAAIIRERARGDAEAGWGLLAMLAGRLAPALPPEAAAAAVLEAAVEAVEAERGFWLVPDGAGGWTATLARGREGAAIAFDPSAVSRGIADHVATTGQALTLLNAAEAEGWQARASVQALGLRTVWCLPAGSADGALLYLDTTELAIADPAGALRGVEVLLRYAAPLLA